MIEETYNKDHRENYFAIRAKFKKWIDEKGNTNETIIMSDDCTFIRRGQDGDAILDVNETDENDTIEKFMFLPSMKHKQRHCIYCQGQAGGGKSYLLDDYISLYKLMHPKNEVLYFTLNNAEIDASLTKENYRIMKMQPFLDALTKINQNLDEFKHMSHIFANKVLVFDDVGNLKNNKIAQKTFWNFIDQSIENFRKFDVNIYIIGHSSRTGHFGTVLKEELTHYIVMGNAMQTKNDRILSTYFGFNMGQIHQLLDGKDRWLCIDTKNIVAIYPTRIKDLVEIYTKKKRR
jgi:hypothetical protein